MRKIMLALGIGLAVAALGPSPAFAQSPQELLRAQKLYDEADKLEQGGDVTAALAKFEEAMKVVETAQLKLRAGRCQEKLGRLIEALANYEQASSLAGDDAVLAKLASDQAAGVLPRVPKLELALASDAPTDVVIKVDGKPTTQRSLRVAAGEHQVTASAQGYQAFAATVSAREGSVSNVTIKLVASDAAPVETPKERPVNVVPWVLIGSAAGVLGASIGLGVYSASAKSSAYDDLAGPAGCVAGDPPQCPWASREAAPNTPEVEAFLSKVDESNVFLGLAIGAGVLAAGLGATGVALLLTGGEAPKAAVLPWGSEHAGGLVAVGRF